MATHIPNSPEAMAALRIKEETSITNEELFGHIIQEVLKLFTSKIAILEQWMKHHGLDSIFDVFSNYYHDPKSIIKDDSDYVNEHGDYQTLFKHISASIILLIY